VLIFLDNTTNEQVLKYKVKDLNPFPLHFGSIAVAFAVLSTDVWAYNS